MLVGFFLQLVVSPKILIEKALLKKDVPSTTKQREVVPRAELQKVFRMSSNRSCFLRSDR
jgi:hypothetical protein